MPYATLSRLVPFIFLKTIKKIKQVNNLRIYEWEQFSPSSCKYSGKAYLVKTPDGKFIERFSSYPLALTFCAMTKDFTKRK
jgi:hypothetical protein